MLLLILLKTNLKSINLNNPLEDKPKINKSKENKPDIENNNPFDEAEEIKSDIDIKNPFDEVEEVESNVGNKNRLDEAEEIKTDNEINENERTKYQKLLKLKFKKDAQINSITQLSDERISLVLILKN